MIRNPRPLPVRFLRWPDWLPSSLAVNIGIGDFSSRADKILEILWPKRGEPHGSGREDKSMESQSQNKGKKIVSKSNPIPKEKTKAQKRGI